MRVGDLVWTTQEYDDFFGRFDRKSNSFVDIIHEGLIESISKDGVAKVRVLGDGRRKDKIRFFNLKGLEPRVKGLEKMFFGGKVIRIELLSTFRNSNGIEMITVRWNGRTETMPKYRADWIKLGGQSALSRFTFTDRGLFRVIAVTKCRLFHRRHHSRGRYPIKRKWFVFGDEPIIWTSFFMWRCAKCGREWTRWKRGKYLYRNGS